MRNLQDLLSIAGWPTKRIYSRRGGRCIVTGVVTVLFVAAIAGVTLPAQSTAQNFVDLKPSPQQVEWQDLEFGVIVHFGLNTFTDKEATSPSAWTQWACP